MMLIFGFLLMTIGTIRASKECNYDAFNDCTTDVDTLQNGDFHIVSVQQLKEVCNSHAEDIHCVRDYVENCLKPEEKEVFEATSGTRLKLIEDMCEEGSRINKGFIQHMNCFRKLQDEIKFCNEKFTESTTLLEKSKMEERQKVFYACCAFEWHRNCLAKIGRMKCNDEASDFMYDVTTSLGGEVQKSLCTDSSSSCQGLHGVNQQEIDEKFENITRSIEENSSTAFTCPTALIIILMYFLYHSHPHILQ